MIMKREIKFRGKRIDNGEWVVGQLAYFFDNKETPYIMPHCYFGTREMGEYDENDELIISNTEVALGGFVSVYPESVGQFVKNNGKNDIYEGDILVQIGNKEMFGVLVYSGSEAKFGYIMQGVSNRDFNKGQLVTGLYSVRVIGNIHDNPELIK